MAEPEWDEATRNLVLALDGVHLCAVCGGPAFLCQDPHRQDDYIADAPIRCHATTARLQRQRAFGSDWHPDALLWPVRLIDRRGSDG